MIIPGVESANDLKHKKKKAILFSDSMANKIDPTEFNLHTHHHSTYFQTFSGANSVSLRTFIEPVLAEDDYETAIIHVGTNDIAPRRHKQQVLTNQEICENIKLIAEKCMSAGIKQIIISGIIPRGHFELNRRRLELNKLIQDMCVENEFCFIENDNIAEKMLRKDKLHLRENGTCKFATNLITILNCLRQ